ncbi:MAG: 4'-phosphopantetheinyl transferase superfamily protein [Prochlorococcus sp.]
MPLELNGRSVMGLWLLPMQTALMPISKVEEQWARQLAPSRARQFRQSRGYVRQALADLWRIPALEIPLQAPPGQPPKLANDWGFISFSHCCDALLIAWAPQQVGVDLERADRPIAAELLSRRFFSSEEQAAISHLSGSALRAAVLEQWLIKEAAIKWQRGSLAKDLIHWRCSADSAFAVHDVLDRQVSVRRIHYSSWRMVVAGNLNAMSHPPMLCLG